MAPHAGSETNGGKPPGFGHRTLKGQPQVYLIGQWGRTQCSPVAKQVRVQLPKVEGREWWTDLDSYLTAAKDVRDLSMFYLGPVTY